MFVDTEVQRRNKVFYRVVFSVSFIIQVSARTMPNDSVPICGCGVAVDLGKGGRTGSGTPSKSNWGSKSSSSVGKSSWDNRGKNQRVQPGDELSRQGQGGVGAAAASGDTGSTSSVQLDQTRILEKPKKSKQGGKRLNSSRRTRSAERPDSHYTYIGT